MSVLTSPSTPKDVQIAILAGGQSRRMGQDKSFVMINGKPMIQQVIDQLATLQLDLMIITNTPASYAQFGLPLYRDVRPNCGSLGGIFTALTHSTTADVLCVACDMPFLSPTLLRYLLALRERVDAVVPVTGENYHSLHAVYSRRCLPVIGRQLEQQNFRISAIFAHLSVRYVDEAELRRFDPQLRSLVNLNSPSEVLHATQMDASSTPTD